MGHQLAASHIAGHPMPNDSDLFDQFMAWCGDEATRKQILVDNPAALYGFE